MNDRTFNHQLLIKWLFLLLCFHVAIFTVAVMDYLPIPDDLINWSHIILTAGTILCFFQLSAVDSRYRLVAIFRTILLARTLFFMLLPDTVLLSLYQAKGYEIIFTALNIMVLVLSWVATCLEYWTHGKLISQQSPKLSKNWTILLLCNLGYALLSSAVSMSIGHLYDVLHLGIFAINVVHYVVQFGNSVFALIYLWFLYQTILKIKK